MTLKKLTDREINRSFRAYRIENDHLKREMTTFQLHMQDVLREVRKEVEELMTLYKHLKIRPLPPEFHCNDKSQLMNAGNKPIKPTSQMEFDTWRLEALNKRKSK